MPPDLVTGLPGLVAPDSTPPDESLAPPVSNGLVSGLPIRQIASVSPVGLLPPPADVVKRYESAGNYNVGYGGVDLSDAPKNEYGFPIWEGKEGPAGISHAAGAYQFEPDTWNRYAKQLGIKDFSPESQDRVFNLAYQTEGLGPWAPYNPRIRQALAGTPYAAELYRNQLASAGTGAPQPQMGGALAVEPLPNAIFRPIAVNAADAGTAPALEVNLGAGGGQAPGMPAGFQAMMALRVLSAMMAKTHQFTPVDYDPWKVAAVGRMGKGGQG